MGSTPTCSITQIASVWVQIPLRVLIRLDFLLYQIGRDGIFVRDTEAKAWADEQAATMQRKQYALLPCNKQRHDKQDES